MYDRIRVGCCGCILCCYTLEISIDESVSKQEIKKAAEHKMNVTYLTSTKISAENPRMSPTIEKNRRKLVRTKRMEDLEKLKSIMTTCV